MLLLPCTTENRRYWKSKVGEDCSSLPAPSSQQSSNQGLQFSFSVEAFLHGYYLDVQGLLHQQLLCTGKWQRTGAVGEEGPAHVDNTHEEVLHPRRRTGSPSLLDHCDEEAGRSNPHRHLTSNDVYPQ